MTKVTRQPVFDLVKAIAIYLVVLGHTIQHYSPIPSQEVPLYKCIYLFHMPLFMIVSGYFSLSSYKLDTWVFFRKKTIALLIPVLIFAFIMTLWFVFLEHRFNMDIISYIALYLSNINIWLWFLRSLFICYTIIYIVTRIVRNVKLRWGLLSIICLCLLPLKYCNLGTMFPCFCAGIILKERNLITNISLQTKLLYISGTLSLAGIVFMLNISSPSPLIFVKYAKTLIGLSISIFIITILYRYRLSRSISFVSDKLEYIGKRTLEIYVLQCFIVEIITPIFLKVPYFSLWSDICIFPLMAVGFLFIILIAENILAYIPFIHKLLFGK